VSRSRRRFRRAALQCLSLQPDHGTHFTAAKEHDMSLLRLRLSGTDADASGLIHLLASIEGVARVEEVDDLMPHLDDEDSSSAGLESDRGVPTNLIEVDVDDAATAARVRRAAETLVISEGSGLEIEEDEAWGEVQRIAPRLH
jgi:hypothetical protein